MLKRRDYFSKKWFQLRIILAYLAVLFGGAAGLMFYLGRYCREALRVEMFRGHSTATSPWEILQRGVINADLVAAAAVVAVAVVLTIVVNGFVARSATRVADNLRSSIDGRTPDAWSPPPGIYEFRYLQQLLSDALARHLVRIEEIREMSRILRERVRAAYERLDQADSAGDHAIMRDLHVKVERLRGSSQQFTLPAAAAAAADADGGAAAPVDELRNVRIGFQVGWILRFSVVSLLSSALMIAIMRRALTTDLGKDFKMAFFVLKHYRELILPILGFSALFYIVVVSVLTSFAVLLLSHRIAGPLFRLEHFAEHLARGDLSFSLQIHGGDELRNLFGAAGRLQEKLLAGLIPLREHFARIDQAWEQLDAATPERYEDEAKRTLSVIEERLRSIEQSLALSVP